MFLENNFTYFVPLLKVSELGRTKIIYEALILLNSTSFLGLYL